MAEQFNFQDRAWTPEQVARLKNMFQDGIFSLGQMDDLREHLAELTKDVGEEIDVSPVLLRRAIRALHKGDLGQSKDALSAVEEILSAAGKVAA